MLENHVLFSSETTNRRMFNVIVREVKTLDQFGKCFKQAIQEHNAPKAICGYVVSALGPLVALSTSYLMQKQEVEALLKRLKDPNIIVPAIEKCMDITQNQRKLYVKEYSHEFGAKKEKDKYITDWIAKYEISDLIQITAPHIENLFFLRYVGYEFPELLKDVKHEERRRFKEEERFKGKRFIVESFCGGSKLQTVAEWLDDGIGRSLNSYDKPLVFIGDLLGHFVTFLACKVLREDGILEDTLFLINSLKDTNAMEYEEVIYTICQLAFPDNVIKI